MITGCSNNNHSQQENTLTESSARQIALEKAGVETATFTKQEYDSSEAEYEFEDSDSGNGYGMRQVIENSVPLNQVL